MTASQQFKALLAGVATVALVSTAFAQGNPPNPAVKSAPVGAGQQSTQGTPMGDTGTPTGSGTAQPSRSSSTTGSSATMGTPRTSSTPMTSGTAGSTSGSTMGSTTTSADTTMASNTGSKSKRRMRADRN